MKSGEKNEGIANHINWHLINMHRRGQRMIYILLGINTWDFKSIDIYM